MILLTLASYFFIFNTYNVPHFIDAWGSDISSCGSCKIKEGTFRRAHNLNNCRSKMMALHAQRGGDIGSKTTKMKTDKFSFTNDSQARTFFPASSSYHLVWSKGFWKKLFVTTTIIQLVLTAGKALLKSKNILKPLPCHTSPLNINTVQIFILPMLSSSCCLLQLVINALSTGIGCMGFNTILGPVRPYFMSILFCSTVIPLLTEKMTVTVRRTTFLVSWTIALLPEMVHFVNSISTRKRTTGLGQNETSENPTLSSDLSQSNVEENPEKNQFGNKTGLSAIVEIDVPTMGCVACIRKINSSLGKLSFNIQPSVTNDTNVSDIRSWLVETGDEKEGIVKQKNDKKGGKVRMKVTSSSQESIESVAKLAADFIVKDAGFSDTSIHSISTSVVGAGKT